MEAILENKRQPFVQSDKGKQSSWASSNEMAHLICLPAVCTESHYRVLSAHTSVPLLKSQAVSKQLRSVFKL